MDNSNASQQIALYEDPDHAVHLDVRVDGDTVWLTQQQMATLFGRGVPTISKHIHSAAKEELAGIRTISFFEIVRLEGTRTVKRQVEHYNLDMIISVGYRVKSQQGVYFRRWANGVLKQHLLQGYSINQKRLEALGTVFKVLERSSTPELSGAAEILQKYLPSLTLLDEYDTGRMKAPQGNEPNWELGYTEALEVIRSYRSTRRPPCSDESGTTSSPESSAPLSGLWRPRPISLRSSKGRQPSLPRSEGPSILGWQQALCSGALHSLPRQERDTAQRRKTPRGGQRARGHDAHDCPL